VSSGRSLDAALAEHEDKVAADDRSLLRMLCYGTLRRHWCLQSWIAQLLDRPLRQRDSVVNALLAVGLFQITESRIPDHAVVSQTVEASRLLRRPKLAGVINAVMRRFLREGLAQSHPKTPEARWNHPEWLIDALSSDWPDDAHAILAANDTRAPMWLRVNTARNTVEEYLAALREADIGASRSELAPGAIVLESPLPVDELPGFTDGLVSVQDGGAQLAAPWLLDDTDGRILDACAAPGGKSGHLLELGGADIALTCVEKDETRMQGVRETLERLGGDATLITADASTPESWWNGEPFDAVLLDAPCSATGVIRRHPDIKLLRRAADIAPLAELQRRLLDRLWTTLAPGGRMLYVTCSVLAAENDAVVGAFLDATADASENTVLQNNNIRDVMRRKTCGYQLLPGTADMDGFYFACLQKAA
jgi:16S rRNA (cytosine967-C5)-methyltransferase